MSEAPTLDFFDRLESQLRRAAARPPRRAVPPLAAIVVAAVAIGVLALIPLALLGGDERSAPSQAGPGLSPVGTVLPKGSGEPRRSAPSMVVARGEKSPVGPWQLEVFRYGKRKALAGEARPRICLMLYTPATPGLGVPGLGGFCGPGELGFRKTPGFSRQQSQFPSRRSRWVLIFGRAPTAASKIVVRLGGARLLVNPQPAPAGFRSRFGFDASFYGVVVPATTVPGARINWLDVSGRPGSRGIRLMPPLTRH